MHPAHNGLKIRSSEPSGGVEASCPLAPGHVPGRQPAWRQVRAGRFCIACGGWSSPAAAGMGLGRSSDLAEDYAPSKVAQRAPDSEIGEPSHSRDRGLFANKRVPRGCRRSGRSGDGPDRPGDGRGYRPAKSH